MDLSYLFLIMLTPILLSYVTSKYFSSEKNLPPGPGGLPIIGNLHQIGKMPHVSTAMLAKIYGPIISLRIVSQTVVVVSTAEAAMEVLKTQDRNLSGRITPDVLQHPIKDYYLIWAHDCNNYWNSMRSFCRTNMLSGKAIAAQSKIRSETVAQMMDFLEKKQGKVVRMEEVVFTTIFNTMCNILFSRDLVNLNDEEDGTANRFKIALEKSLEYAMTTNVSDLFPVLRGLDIQGLKKDNLKQINEICSITDKIIDQRRQRNSTEANLGEDEEKDFLDLLLQDNMTNDQINILVNELFVAGTDTVATTIQWCIAELLKNKHIMDKLQQELRNGIGSNSITSIMETDFSTFSYFSACIKETLRLHPVVPLLLPRQALQTCQVMGYTIPKNSHVWVNIWAISRDPHVWEDPNSFIPERFLGTQYMDFTHPEFKYTPFGGGRRMCPGLRYGIKSLETILASLILRFDWVLPNDEDSTKHDMNEHFRVVLGKEKPLELIFNKKI